jgi:prevent-host-death family protein
MSSSSISASEFKASCLSLLDRVAETHETIVITKHGKPIARLVALDDSEPMIGSVVLLSDDESDYFSTGSQWDIESD